MEPSPKPVIPVDEFLSAARKRKQELGIVDTPETTEALRNKGSTRTPEKRELLRRTAERARAAGLAPIKAYF